MAHEIKINVNPDADGFFQEVAAKLLPEAHRLGEQLGDAISKDLASKIRTAITEGIGSAPAGTQGRKTGSDFASAFDREVKTKIAAALKSLPKANLTADSSQADIAIARIREELGAIGNGIGVDLDDKAALDKIKVLQAELIELSTNDANIRVRVNSGASAAELAALQVQLAKLDGTAAQATATINGSGPGGGGGALVTAIVALGTAAIPLGAYLSTAAGAVATAGGTALLIFKGISAEVKAGTQLGVTYGRQFDTLKENLAGLENTAAQGFLSPVIDGTRMLQAFLPALNDEVHQFTGLIGAAGLSVEHGLLESLQKLRPLFTQIIAQAVGLAGGFDRFASGNGLDKFVRFTQENMPGVVHTLESVSVAIGHLIVAGSGAGVSVVTALGAIADGINAIPVDVLKVAVPLLLETFLAFKAAGYITIASAALTTFSIKMGLASTQTGIFGATAGLAASGAAKLSAALGTIGLVAAGLYAAIQVNNAIADHFTTATKTGTDAALALQKVNAAGKFAGDTVNDLSGGYKKLSTEINNGFKASNFQKFKDSSVLGIKAPFDSATSSADKFFKSTDAGLAQLVSSGNAGQAANVFKIISDQAKAQGVTMDQLLKKFPAYKALLDSTKIATIGLAVADSTTKDSFNQLSVSAGISAGVLQKYAALVGITSDEVDAGALKQGDLADKIRHISLAYGLANTAQTAYLDSLQAFNSSAGTAADRATILGAALQAARGFALDFATTNLQGVTAVQAAGDALKEYRNSIGKNGELLGQMIKQGDKFVQQSPKLAAGSLAIAQALTQQATTATEAAKQTYQNELATKGATVAAQDAVGIYTAYRDSLIQTARQSGLTQSQAKALADQYLAVPANVDTFIKQFGGDSAQRTTQDLTDALLKLNGTLAKIFLDVDDQASGPIGNLHSIIDDIPRNINIQFNILGGQKVHDAVNDIPRSNAVIPKAQGGILKAYANGGFEKHVPQIARTVPNSVRVWAEPETRGEAYIPLANDLRRPRALEIWRQTGNALGVEGFALGAVNAPSSAGGGSAMPSEFALRGTVALLDNGLLDMSGATLVALSNSVNYGRTN